MKTKNKNEFAALCKKKFVRQQPADFNKYIKCTIITDILSFIIRCYQFLEVVLDEAFIR